MNAEQRKIREKEMGRMGIVKFAFRSRKMSDPNPISPSFFYIVTISGAKYRCKNVVMGTTDQRNILQKQCGCGPSNEGSPRRYYPLKRIHRNLVFLMHSGIKPWISGNRDIALTTTPSEHQKLPF